jgi:8-oxo-dGTP diphosphatase
MLHPGTPIRPCVSALLLTPDRKVIIQLRDDKRDLPFPAHWATLGGQIESGETPEQAMRRELYEETELTLPLTYWRRIDHAYVWNGRPGYVENYAFVGHFDGVVSEIRLHEGQRLDCFNAEEIDHIPIAYGLEKLLKEFFIDYVHRIGSNL